MAFVYAYFFSDFLCFDMSLILLTVTLRGVSNKHCLLPFFSFYLFLSDSVPTCLECQEVVWLFFMAHWFRHNR